MNAQRQAATEYMAQFANILREFNKLGVAVELDVKININEDEDYKAAIFYLDPLGCHLGKFNNNIVFEYHVI